MLVVEQLLFRNPFADEKSTMVMRSCARVHAASDPSLLVYAMRGASHCEQRHRISIPGNAMELGSTLILSTFVM